MKSLILLLFLAVSVWADESPRVVILFSNDIRSVTMSFTNFTTTNWATFRSWEKMTVAEQHVRAMKSDGSLPVVINALAISGEVCKVRGHAWTVHMHTTLEYFPGRMGCRLCAICGSHQNQFSEWK